MELNNEAIRAKTELEIKKLEIVEHIADKSIDIASNTCKAIKRNPVIFMGVGVGVVMVGFGVVIVGGSILLQNKMLNATL